MKGERRRRLSSEYDGLGNITSMVDEGTAGTTRWSYDAVGRPESRSTPHGVTTSWSYDDRDRVLSVVHTRDSDGVVLASRTYTRTRTGEPTRIEREDGSYVALAYDEANRVRQEQHVDASDVVQTTIAYTYDSDGNRATRTVDGVTETYVYSPGAQLDEVTVGGVATQTFSYDGAGRATSIARPGQDFTLSFDPDGNVVGIDDGGVPLARYRFDGEGRRERVTHGGVERRFLIAPAMADGFESPHAVIDEAGQLVARWVYAGEHAVMRVAADGSITFFLRDPMGTLLGKTDGAGSATASFQYDAFGEVLVATGSEAALEPSLLGETRLHGMWRDLSGLYFVRARSYDPKNGRFLGLDPEQGGLTHPRSLRSAAFAFSNPTLARDPSGRITFAETSAAQTIQSNARRAEASRGGQASRVATQAANRVNLPSWKKVTIDIQHILRRHVRGGLGAGPRKTLFPQHMGRSQIERAVRQAYRVGRRIETQGSRVRVRGTYDNLVIEMWVDRAARVIETAYPIF